MKASTLLIVAGLADGTVYALMAASICMVYRPTRLVNFAHGTFAYLALLCFISLDLVGVPLGVALVAAVAIAAATGLMFGSVAPRMSASAGPLVPLIGSFALYLALSSLITAVWGAGEPYSVPSIFGTSYVSIFGASLQVLQLGAIGAAVVIALAALIVSRRSRIGLLVRAVSSNREVAETLGVSSRSIQLVGWASGTALGLVASYLYVNLSSVSDDVIQQLLLQAFAVAAVGAFVSYRAVAIGGIALGLLQALFARYLSFGGSDILALGVVTAVLLALPRGALIPAWERE
jgi:branched-chain amino acid transport system permease protein